MSHINEEHNSEVLSHSERWPLKIGQHAHISRLVILLTDESPVSCLGSLVASSGRVDNEVDKRIIQASQAIGALRKSVCLDPLYCMWRPGTPYAEICMQYLQ